MHIGNIIKAMRKPTDFLHTYRHAIWWTVGYAVFTYIILHLLFGFDMLSLRQWSILYRAQLRGFAGFAFGIMILAAIPLYIATTTLIVRKKKPLFELFPKKKTEKPESKPAPEPAPEPPVMPAYIPTELRGAFLRAKKNITSYPVTQSEPSAPEPAQPEPTAALPLPDDFDFTMAPEQSAAPMFREISFDSPKPAAPDGIIIRDGFAIATHDDDDFWVADDETWFANGKQKPSPVMAALGAARDNNLKPALRLVARNIMDIDSKIAEWESMGIEIMTGANSP